MTAMLNIKDLRAYYGQVQALHGLSFSLNEGSLTTLLGANGAGKTTLFGMILGLTRPDGGTIKVFGLDPTTAGPEVRARLKACRQWVTREQKKFDGAIDALAGRGGTRAR